MSLDVNEFPLSQTLIPYRSGSTCTRGHSERGKKAFAAPVPFSVPFALLYIENTVQRAICCRLSCCSYVVTRIRVLPEEPFFFSPNLARIPKVKVVFALLGTCCRVVARALVCPLRTIHRLGSMQHIKSRLSLRLMVHAVGKQ